jgi:CheY-like chemotaxis protein
MACPVPAKQTAQFLDTDGTTGNEPDFCRSRHNVGATRDAVIPASGSSGAAGALPLLMSNLMSTPTTDTICRKQAGRSWISRRAVCLDRSTASFAHGWRRRVNVSYTNWYYPVAGHVRPTPDDPNLRGGRGKRKIVEPSSILTGVIVADDDPIIRSVLRAALEAIDLNVFVADNGLEAVRLAARIQAALIILDFKMPQLNGLVACQHIRQLRGNAQTPIVMLTSSFGNDFEAAAASVGVTEYHVKPFRTALLMQAVARFLPISDAARDLIRRNADRANGIAEATIAPAG